MRHLSIILFLGFILAFGSSLYAQDDSVPNVSIKKKPFLPDPVARGRMIIGGSADLSNTFNKNNGSFNLSLAPSFGFFVTKGLAIGGRYSFAVGTSKSFDVAQYKNVTTTAFTTFVGPLVKYYFGPKQFKGVVSANGGYSVYTALRGTAVSNYNGFAAGGSIGMAHFFNQNLSLETLFYLNTAGYEKQLPVTRFGISLGLFAFLDTKKKE